MHVIQMIVSDRHTKCGDRHAKKLELRDRQTPDEYPMLSSPAVPSLLCMGRASVTCEGVFLKSFARPNNNFIFNLIHALMHANIVKFRDSFMIIRMNGYNTYSQDWSYRPPLHHTDCYLLPWQSLLHSWFHVCLAHHHGMW